MEEKVIQFQTGATRSDDTDKLDYEGFLSPGALKLFAEYMHKHRRQADGQLRASDNWQKGMPISRYRKSLIRHVFEFWALIRGRGPLTPYGQSDYIETLSAILFNVQGLLHEAAKGNYTDVDQMGLSTPGPVFPLSEPKAVRGFPGPIDVRGVR